MVLSISVLAGITFEYNLPNTENEVLLLVDTSFSGEESEDDKDDFIKSVIDNSDSMFKLGIVTFGYDQVYAVELTNDTGSIYTEYLKSPSPDTSATDIASALQYAAGLFSSPESARIVLMTDAVETDGNAAGVIKSIAAQGIKVDTVFFPEDKDGDEVQLIKMESPNQKIKVGDKFSITLTVQSSYTGTATITPYDNDAPGESMDIELSEGMQTIQIPYIFAVPGMHKMSFELTSDDDTLTQNNIYNSYMYLEIFEKILVIERNDAESQAICRMLKDELKVTVVNVADTDKMPKTVDELRQYDEVILCNIANSDMPDGFDEVLHSYVADVGGGLFTVCGNDQEAAPGDDGWTANAYTRDDMYGSIYQQMLPVEIIDYTPPLAVMIIIDRSGSMYDPEGKEDYEDSKLYFAKLGAIECVEALTERDYVGVMSLGDDYEEQIELTPRPQRDKIIAAINELSGIDGSEGGGGTLFSPALQRAGKALSAMSTVEKKHIIIVTDGEPSAEDEENYKYWMEENAKLGITMSIVGIQCSVSGQQKMVSILEDYAGMTADNFHPVENLQLVAEEMKMDLMQPEIKDVNYEPFSPTITSSSTVTNGITQEAMDTIELEGFYGVKLKDGATSMLMGEYTPIYSQWQYGKGTVGTFACDLDGTFSANLIDTDVGETLLNNIVVALFPTENIRPKEVEAEVSGNNYTTQLSVFTDLDEGETVEVVVTSPLAEGESEPLVQTLSAGLGGGYSRFSFAVKTPGIHEILVYKKDAEGNVIENSETTVYKALSYSQEYNLFTDPEVAEDLIESLAADGKGSVLTEPWQVFENVVKYLHRSIDPRIPFIITALVLFLLDIAVRKFKWKWPHEIIRDKKAQEALSN